MRGNIGLGRYEKNMDRRFQRNTPPDMNKRAVFREGGVQGAEWIALLVEVASEMGFQRFRVAGNFFSKA